MKKMKNIVSSAIVLMLVLTALSSAVSALSINEENSSMVNVESDSSEELTLTIDDLSLLRDALPNLEGDDELAVKEIIEVIENQGFITESQVASITGSYHAVAKVSADGPLKQQSGFIFLSVPFGVSVDVEFKLESGTLSIGWGPQVPATTPVSMVLFIGRHSIDPDGSGRSGSIVVSGVGFGVDAGASGSKEDMHHLLLLRQIAHILDHFPLLQKLVGQL